MMRGNYWYLGYWNRSYFGGTWLRAGSAFGPAQLVFGIGYVPGLKLGVVRAD